MTKDDAQIARLEQIGEDIETISVNDTDAWLRLVQEIRTITVPEMPAAEDFRLLLGLCCKGLEKIAAKETPDLFGLMAQIAGGTDLVAAALLTPEDVDGEAARQAVDALTAMVGDAGEAPAAASTEALSLDDAAALMVQLEPEDIDDIASLKNALAQAAEDSAYPSRTRAHLRTAVAALAAMIDKSADDPEASLAEAGKAVEQAIFSRDDPAAIAEDGNAAEAVPHPEPEDAPAADPAGGTPLPPPVESRDDYMPEDVDPDLMGEFVTEANDLISRAEDALLALENDPEDAEAVSTVFRAFHTVKGTAAFMDLTLIAEMGHHAESLLSRVRDGEIRYSGGYADLSLQALDTIKELVGRARDALGGEAFTKPDGYDELMRILSDPEAAGISESSDNTPPPRLGDLLVAEGKADRESVEKAAQATSGEPLGEKLVHSKAAKVKDVGQALRTQRRIKTGGVVVDSSVRVSTQRLDRLIDMVGELVIAHSMVAQDEIVNDNQHHALAKKISHTTKIVRELQDMSMSMRMVPLKATFNKMARLVRDLAKKIGKRVNLVTEGEDTEIDRNLVDVINDPLVHMVRNAIDHGIESPEERVAAGKSEVGTVALAAYHSAGRVVVEIRDDGKGLDKERILAKAEERDLIKENVNLNDKDIYNLIFEPGFSTAQTVTDVSGRGVGMDVVKRNIESLRGQVEIDSRSGKGSVFKMSLPLTLAIIDGMVVRVATDRYIIPTISIVRSIKPGEGDVSSVFRKGRMLSLQGALIPLFRLADIYTVGSGKTNGGGSDQGLVVVVEDDGKQAGFIIDELIGRQQVVIKTLGETMQNIPGIAGGAIMPNGRVGLILDVGGLIKHANSDIADTGEEAQAVGGAVG